MVKSAVSLVSKAALPPESPQQIGSPVGSCQLDAAMVNSASSNFTPTQEKDRRFEWRGLCYLHVIRCSARVKARNTTGDRRLRYFTGASLSQSHWVCTAPLVHVSAPDQRSSRAEAAGAARDAVTRATSAAAGVALWLK